MYYFTLSCEWDSKDIADRFFLPLRHRSCSITVKLVFILHFFYIQWQLRYIYFHPCRVWHLLPSPKDSCNICFHPVESMGLDSLSSPFPIQLSSCNWWVYVLYPEPKPTEHRHKRKKTLLPADPAKTSLILFDEVTATTPTTTTTYIWWAKYIASKCN